jgi:hypothetical protein
MARAGGTRDVTDQPRALKGAWGMTALPLVGYEQSYVILGGLLLAGGVIGLLFIRPQADRARLAAHTVMLPVAMPARA